MSGTRKFQQAVIIGAGPYGLSIAAHLRNAGVLFRIFGSLMETWSRAMPAGMLLKSDGFASNLSDPTGVFTLEHFCKARAIPYDHTRIPVRLDTFVQYGRAFQEQLVPELESERVVSVEQADGRFRVLLDSGETVITKTVIVAVGVTHFAWIPPALANIPAPLLQHSSVVENPASFQGKHLTVIGAGASAIDIAALLHESGAHVTLVARRQSLRFHGAPSDKSRSAWERLRHPQTGIGPGLRSKFYTDAPLLFHKLPLRLRLRILRAHLGPSGGWPMRERILGQVPMILGCEVMRAEVAEGAVRLILKKHSGAEEERCADQVIAATGYRTDLRRLGFLGPEVLTRIAAADHAPLLRRDFQSSLPGLYFAGLAAANSFGPMFRFVYGADFTARHITKNLTRHLESAS